MPMDEFVTAGEQPVYSEAEPTVVTGEDGSSLEVRCAFGGPEVRLMPGGGRPGLGVVLEGNEALVIADALRRAHAEYQSRD
jgi:hypothetical protein